MGRKSREKLRRKRDPEYRIRVHVKRAEARGNRVSPTLESYERLARARGSDGVAEALIARHNRRWSNVRRNTEFLADHIVETLHVVFPMDVFLWKEGVRFTEPPSSFYGEWSEHLRWAIDSACQAARMVLGCNVLGATAIARTQLERWSANRSTSSNHEQRDGVSTVDHYSFIWDHEGLSLSAGKVWVDLSRVLHGRGDLIDAARWEAAQLADPGGTDSRLNLARTVLTAVQLSLRQVMLCVASLAEELGYASEYYQTLRHFPITLPSEISVQDAPLLIWPINLNMIGKVGPAMVANGKSYLAEVEKLASEKPSNGHGYSLRSFEALASRRSRAVALAMLAFDKERRDLGATFSPANLAIRENGYILINEIAGLFSQWTEGCISDALVTGSCALRASYWLWLEDDDRSLVLMRTVIEQAARLRTWRLKRDKAATIEDRDDRVSSRDWLEAAGWRRLSILNRSLGEFSHASPKSRWSGARAALTAIQKHDPSLPSSPEFTTRGNTLNEAAFAFGFELSHLTRQFDGSLADALRDLLPYPESDDDYEGHLKEWLERCWSHRGRSFGAFEFTADDDH